MMTELIDSLKRVACRRDRAARESGQLAGLAGLAGKPRAQVVEQGAQIELEQRGHARAQTRRLQVWHAGDRLQKTQELFAARWPAQDVEAVADLGSCQLTQIGVELPEDVSDLVSLHGGQSKRRAVRSGPFVPFVG